MHRSYNFYVNSALQIVSVDDDNDAKCTDRLPVLSHKTKQKINE